MSGVVTKSITAENTFSDVMKTQGYFNLSISGIAGGTVVTVQKQSVLVASGLIISPRER